MSGYGRSRRVRTAVVKLGTGEVTEYVTRWYSVMPLFVIALNDAAIMLLEHNFVL